MSKKQSSIKKFNFPNLPKCVRCCCELIDDFQLIFDETGLELELQKLLAICFDLDIKLRLNEVQALCDPCMNELIDAYDMIQNLKELEGAGKLPNSRDRNDSTSSSSGEINVVDDDDGNCKNNEYTRQLLTTKENVSVQKKNFEIFENKSKKRQKSEKTMQEFKKQKQISDNPSRKSSVDSYESEEDDVIIMSNSKDDSSEDDNGRSKNIDKSSENFQNQNSFQEKDNTCKDKDNVGDSLKDSYESEEDDVIIMSSSSNDEDDSDDDDDDSLVELDNATGVNQSNNENEARFENEYYDVVALEKETIENQEIIENAIECNEEGGNEEAAIEQFDLEVERTETVIRFFNRNSGIQVVEDDLMIADGNNKNIEMTNLPVKDVYAENVFELKNLENTKNNICNVEENYNDYELATEEINKENYTEKDVERVYERDEENNKEYHHVDYLDDFDENIDPKQYKSQILQNSTFQDVQFPTGIECSLCSKIVENHVDVLMHTKTDHAIENFAYPCIIDKNCEPQTTEWDLSLHLLFKHYDLDGLLIYCKCPECKKMFNSFPDYNKHSCYNKGIVSHVKVDCDECGRSFTSNRRYRFHLQFHIEKRRPKACLICDKLFRDHDEFFEHIMYFHEKNIENLCLRCDISFSSKEYYIRHIISHKTEQRYSCTLCSKTYKQKHYLRDHMTTYHGEGNAYPCHICGKSFLYVSSLDNHILSHNKPKPTEVICCSVCGFVAENEKSAEDHLQEHDDNSDACTLVEVVNKAFCCEYCELVYYNIEKLNEHRNTHKDKIFECPNCRLSTVKLGFRKFKQVTIHRSFYHPGFLDKRKNFPVVWHYVCDLQGCTKTYSKWASLQIHKKLCYLGKRIKCPKCKGYFKNKSEFDAHMETVHNGFDYPCQYCEKMFATKLSLGAHIGRKHVSSSLRCDKCGNSYVTAKQLEQHIYAKHTKFTCEICGLSLTRLYSYRTHKRNVHSKEQRYFCQYCKKGFFSRRGLRHHEDRVHLKTPIYKCQVCRYETTHEGRLEQHKSTCKGATTTCEICGKKFRKKSSLISHTKLHNSEKDFKCPHEGCEYSYVERSHLRNHIRINHGERNETKKKRRHIFKVPRTTTFIDDDDGLDSGPDEEPIQQGHNNSNDDIIEEEEYNTEDSIEEDENEQEQQENQRAAVIVMKNFSADDHNYIIQTENNSDM